MYGHFNECFIFNNYIINNINSSCLNKMESDALDRLHLVHARLLYIISEMHGEKTLTDD